MSTTTTNYGLVKPSGSDVISIQVIDNDLDSIDTNLYAKADKSSLVCNVRDYGAVGNSSGAVGDGTDDYAAFAAAIAAGTATRTGVYVPPGRYRLSNTITLGVGQSLVGAGGGHASDVTTATTSLVFDNGVDGVYLAGTRAQLLGVFLCGGTGDVNGVTVTAHGTRCMDVAIQGFGQDGYHCDSRSPTTKNCNVSYCQNMTINSCGRDGMYLAGQDSNSCMYVDCDMVANGRNGITSSSTARNTFIGINLEENAADGIYDNGNSNMYDAYFEGGNGDTLNLGSESSWGIYNGRYYGMATITGDTNAMKSWQINMGQVARGRIRVGDATGSASGKRWSIESGTYGAGWFSIANITDNVAFFRGETATPAAYWHAHQRPNATNTYDLGSSSLRWKDLYLSGVLHMPTYATTGRPSASTAGAGACYYDTTVSMPVWSDGSTWKNAAGTSV